MAVLAEETQKVVSNLYDEYQTEQLYKKQYEETVGQVQPEQSAENNDDLKKNLKDAEVLVESAFNEKEQVSLRLPEITKYTDEKEVELTGLYGEPVEVKNMKKYSRWMRLIMLHCLHRKRIPMNQLPGKCVRLTLL